MASFTFNNKGPDPDPKPTTTFVQADPSNFRAVVQKLTGATAHKQTISFPSRHAGKSNFNEVGNRRPGHRLHERRKAGRKLEIILNKVAARERGLSGDGEVVTASPVSTLDVCGRGSPGTPVEEEEKAIAEKGFYLHPSPMRGSEPELLVLFPLNSPTNDDPSLS